MLAEHDGYTADAGVADRISAYNVVPQYLPLNEIVVPAFIPAINTYGIGPIYRTILNNPVVPPMSRDGTALGDRCAISRMGTGEAA